MHRIYVKYELKNGCWRCQFLDQDRGYRAICQRTYLDPDKLFALARRGGCLMNLEEIQSIERGIHSGRGGLILNLNSSQYQRLRKVQGLHNTKPR